MNPTRPMFEPTDQLAKDLSTWVNKFDSRPEREALAKEMANDHPTLQQAKMRVFMAFVQEMASKEYFDARNEASVKLARQIIALWDGDPYGPPLPLI